MIHSDAYIFPSLFHFSLLVCFVFDLCVIPHFSPSFQILNANSALAEYSQDSLVYSWYIYKSWSLRIIRTIQLSSCGWTTSVSGYSALMAMTFHRQS